MFKKILPCILILAFFASSCKKAADGGEVEITPTDLTITLPNNCPASFTIKNIGAKGSILEYSVNDIGVLRGYLAFTNPTGRLKSGETATISVTVKPDFTYTGFGTLAPATLILTIKTPDASNYIQQVVSVDIRSILGIWSGTWSGVSENNQYGQKTAQVGGTWELNLESIDLDSLTASGTLTWNGIDNDWNPIENSNGSVVSYSPHPFVPNRTISFGRNNSFVTWYKGSCIARLNIDGMAGAVNAWENYGPWIMVNLNTADNTAYQYDDDGFATHPYNWYMTFSTYGNLEGHKQ